MQIFNCALLIDLKFYICFVMYFKMQSMQAMCNTEGLQPSQRIKGGVVTPVPLLELSRQ